MGAPVLWSHLRLHSSGTAYQFFGSNAVSGDSRPSWEQFDYANLWPISGFNRQLCFTE